MTQSPTDTGRRCDATAALFLILATAFRLWYAGTHELLQDEAYYWQWSRHLAWGYYDNTPLIAPIIRMFTLILGQNELGVRAGAVICALVASLFIYLIARKLFDPAVAMASLLLTGIFPLFAIGAITMTQDPVQMAFWGATLYAVLLALEGRAWCWPVAGILTGLTALAKLNGWLIVPSILLILICSPEHRRWLRRPEPYIACLIALAEFAPFLWWNHTHNDAFWRHIHYMGTRSDEHATLFEWFFRFLGDQTIELSPILMVAFLYALFAAPRERTCRFAYIFVWAPAVSVFGATALLSLHSRIEGNWAVASYLTGTVLVADLLVRAWRSGNKGLRALAVFACALSTAIALVGFFPNVFYGLGLKFHDPRQDRTNELYGWKDVTSRIAAERQAMGGDPFIFGVNYRVISEVAFYTPGHPEVYSLYLSEHRNEYMFWENPASLIGRNAVFVHDTDNPDHIKQLSTVFKRVELQAPILVYRDPPYGHHAVRIIQVFRCYGFKGYDPDFWSDGW